MWRSEPQIPLASTRTSTSSGEPISGSAFSSTRTSPGAWKVTARTAQEDRVRTVAQAPTSVLITGCSSGIGHATAKRLAEGGWTVYATARRPESIADLAEAGCKTLALDVTDESSMKSAVGAVEE